jgi:gliding motility-associated-like protein
LVYNRWGNKVFEHNSSDGNPYMNNMWDGTFNGQLLPVASYYYIIETNDSNSTKKYEGTVTILQ